MNRDLAASVARSLDGTPELLLLLPEVFAGLDELGARVSEVRQLVEPLGLDRDSHVLDLGCGKGAVAVALAREHGCTVRGVDAMPEFIDDARDRARSGCVSERCEFAVGDIRSAVETERDHDLAMLLALDDVLGDARSTVGKLRECVRPGAHVLIDDAFLAGDAPPDLDIHCADHAMTVAMLEAHGDVVQSELVVDGPESYDHYRAMCETIVARTAELARRYPQHASALRAFADRQVDATELLCGPVIGALWLIRRAPFSNRFERS